MGSPSGNDRARASRLRLLITAGKTLEVDDAQWFAEYEKARAAQREAKAASRGASARKVHTTEFREHVEEAASVGEGDAAVGAATAAQVTAMVREEGRREDNLARIGIEALKESANFYRDMCRTMIEEHKENGRTHRKLLMALHTSIITNAHQAADAILTDAEREGDKAEESDDGISGLAKLAEQIAPLLGIKLPGATNGKAKGTT